MTTQDQAKQDKTKILTQHGPAQHNTTQPVKHQAPSSKQATTKTKHNRRKTGLSLSFLRQPVI
jgi:hypothetical protein